MFIIRTIHSVSCHLQLLQFIHFVIHFLIIKFVYSISLKKWYSTNIIWELLKSLLQQESWLAYQNSYRPALTVAYVILGGRVLILPVIPGGIKCGIPPGIVGIPPRIPGGIDRISPGINGGIPPGTFHNPGRDPSWDPSKKRRDPTWDEHGIPGGIGGIPHLILTWVIVNGFQPTKLLSFRIACDRRPAKGSCFPFRGTTNSIRFFFIQTSRKLVRTLYHPLKRLSLNTAWMHFCT